MKSVFRLAAVLIVTSSGSLAVAQEPVSVVLRSGESLDVELLDLHSGTFAVRQHGLDFQIRVDLVAALIFGGEAIPDSFWDRAADGRHLMVLRDGVVVEGRLFDIGGTVPLLVRFETPDGLREHASTLLSWIVLSSRPRQSASADTVVDLNGTYLAPSSGPSLTGAIASATTHPRGDRRNEGQVYEINEGILAREGTYTPYSDDFRKPQRLAGIDLRGKALQCDVDLHDTGLWQPDAEFFQIGAGRQADPSDTRTEELFVFIYRHAGHFALYMETDWALYRPATTYYAAPDETRFRLQVAIDHRGTEARLTVTPLDGATANVPHAVEPLPLDLEHDEVRRASLFAGFTQNLPGIKSRARVTLDGCRIQDRRR